MCEHLLVSTCVHIHAVRWSMCGGCVPYLVQFGKEGTAGTPSPHLHSNCAGGILLTGDAHCGSWSSTACTVGSAATGTEQASSHLISQRVTTVGAACGKVQWRESL